MKRTRIALSIAAVLFAASASAATTVSGPAMPSDLATAWEMMLSDSCKKPDGTVISRNGYVKKDGTSQSVLAQITKNGETVALYDGPIVTVRQPNGTWLRYDRATETPDSTAAVGAIVGLTPREYMECAQ